MSLLNKVNLLVKKIDKVTTEKVVEMKEDIVTLQEEKQVLQEEKQQLTVELNETKAKLPTNKNLRIQKNNKGPKHINKNNSRGLSRVIYQDV